jgi:hypothetical protein
VKLTVTLAEKPADILAYLVDHGPATAFQILGAMGDGAQQLGGLFSGGLSLLCSLGLVEGPGGELDRSWKATADGVRAIERARGEGAGDE